MASLTDALASMKNKNTQTTPVVNQRYQVQYINYSYLEESAYNFYPMSEIEELADAIELAGGILQPLLVRRKAPGQRYEIIAGHRRWTAAKYLVDQGKEKFAMLPCHVQDGNDLIARINLIITNSQREKSAYVKMQEVVELEQLLQELAAGSADERAKFSRITGIKLESENITARVLRKLVAKTAGLSETNVARLKHINSSLQPELKEVLEEGKIGISAADELARMAPEEQQEAAKQIKKGEKVQLPKKKITETTKSPNQEPKVVSVLDTKEQLPGQMNMEEYIPMPEPANAFELIEDEEQNAEQEVKKEEKKEESLELYRSQLKELTKEYDADDELIELTQLRSPRLGVTGGGSNQKGLDQICQAVEQQRKAYREAVYEEMQRVLAAYNRVQKVHLCYLHLPQKQKAVLEGLYIKKKMYKELEGPGLSETTIHRLRRQALKNIQDWYNAGRFEEQK